MKVAQSAPDIQARKLMRIRLLHTVIWAIMAMAILALPWLAWSGQFRLAFWFTFLVLGECLVLALNGGRCPVTDRAARYTTERAANFDIYLPLWLARYNKQIFGFLFVAGELVLLWRWARRPGL
jgi:hypothetical protein